MSKKSRKRNKKIIAMLALAGGAALAGRGKGAVSTAGQPVGVNRMSTNTPPIGGTDHIKKAVVADAADAAGTDSRFDTRFSKPGQEIISKAERSQNLAANAAKNAAMNYQRSQTFDARPRPTSAVVKGRNFSYKKGGSVTGIAKRGFGRALMKGKK